MLGFIRYSAGSDRREVARELNLPLPTVVSSVKRLLSTGELVAVDAEHGRSLRGRGRHPLRASGPSPLIALINWRGGQLHAGIYDMQQQLRWETTVEAPEPRSGPEGLVPIVEEVIESAGRLPEGALTAVIISVPAPFLRGTGAPREHSMIRDLPRGFHVTNPEDFDAYLGKRFDLTVITENNANLAAIGEQYGRSDRIGSFIYLKIGYDGIGSAVVTNGRLTRGSHGYGGELAHLQLDRDGRICHCGGRGCLWMKVRELTLPDSTDNDADPINLTALTGLADDGDHGAHRILADIGRLLARPLGHISTFLDPDMIIVDNTIGDAVDHIVNGIREGFAVETPPVIAGNVRIEKSGLADTAEIRGALEIPRESARRARSDSAR